MSLALSSNKRQRTTKSYSSTQILVLEQELESLKAELEHERSLRALDSRRAQQEQERLSQQIIMAVDEAKASKKLLEDWQDKSQKMQEKMRQARDVALAHARELQLQLDEQEDIDQEDTTHWQSECHRLERELEAAAEKEEDLLQEIQELKERPQIAPVVETPAPPARTQEDFKPDMLKEMERLRIQLAEAERVQRQLKRKIKSTEDRHLTVTREREQALLQVKGLPALRKEHEQLQSKYEMLVQQHKSWKEFGERLAPRIRSGRPSDGLPPDVSVVLRTMDKATQKADGLEKSLAASHKEVEGLQAILKTHESNAREFKEKERQWTVERDEWKQKLDTCELESEMRLGQIQIYKREAENLRTLIKTFEDMPAGSSRGGGDIGTSAAVKERLSATEQERDLLQKDRDRLSLQVADLLKKQETQRQELDRVREKFMKLREALQAEKDKVATAEARAHQAEARAGSGAFNPEHTRVLHIEETPLTLSLKEEIAVLKRQLESRGDNPSKHDPDKLNQRLKQNFKEQIALFREGVYLMTGYKVDMLPGNPQERPSFRVRSMFAEREEDHLLLKWPQSEASSLDILGTDLAKALASTHSYQYMTKFQSLPAFLASVQLSLFEKQTMM